jgi:undecaprenyl-diphosphatase
MIDAVMIWLSNWGSAVPLLCVLATRDKKAVRNLILTLLLTWGLTDLLKLAFARPRPFQVGAAPLIGAAPDGYSMPSQHAAFTFTSATTAFLSSAALGWIGFVFAALVAYSRVYLGVHYWSDIIAGAILGSAIAFGVSKGMDHLERANNKLAKYLLALHQTRK